MSISIIKYPNPKLPAYALLTVKEESWVEMYDNRYAGTADSLKGHEDLNEDEQAQAAHADAVNYIAREAVAKYISDNKWTEQDLARGYLESQQYEKLLQLKEPELARRVIELEKLIGEDKLIKLFDMQRSFNARDETSSK